jgi:hypothetical protein
VLDLVLDKINPLNLGDVLTPACELGVQMPEVADSDKPVEIWVDSDRQDLLLRSYLENPATGDLAAGAQMISDGDGGYSASLEPIPGTWRLVVETIAERPVTRVEDLIYIAPK